MGHLVLVRAVVVHLPDFFVTAAVTDKIDLALRNSGNSTAQSKADLLGKLVGSLARCVCRGGIGVLLAKNLRRADVLHVIEPAMNNHAVAGRSQVAKSQHGSIRRRPTPRLKSNFRRISRSLERVE